MKFAVGPAVMVTAAVAVMTVDEEGDEYLLLPPLPLLCCYC